MAGPSVECDNQVSIEVDPRVMFVEWRGQSHFGEMGKQTVQGTYEDDLVLDCRRTDFGWYYTQRRWHSCSRCLDDHCHAASRGCGLRLENKHQPYDHGHPHQYYSCQEPWGDPYRSYHKEQEALTGRSGCHPGVEHNLFVSWV